MASFPLHKGSPCRTLARLYFVLLFPEERVKFTVLATGCSVFSGKELAFLKNLGYLGTMAKHPVQSSGRVSCPMPTWTYTNSGGEEQVFAMSTSFVFPYCSTCIVLIGTLFNQMLGGWNSVKVVKQKINPNHFLSVLYFSQHGPVTKSVSPHATWETCFFETTSCSGK